MKKEKELGQWLEPKLEQKLVIEMVEGLMGMELVEELVMEWVRLWELGKEP